MYREFKLDSMRAADTDDVECVLKAAASAEILLKQTAWMLSWEATAVLTSDPSSVAAQRMDPDNKPASPLGSVLALRLKGKLGQHPRLRPGRPMAREHCDPV